MNTQQIETITKVGGVMARAPIVISAPFLETDFS